MTDVDASAQSSEPPDDPLAPLRQARERFVEAFPGRCSAITVLAESIADAGNHGPVRALRHIVHQMAGLAGTIGFPSVSEIASDVEQMVIAIPTTGVDRPAMAATVSALKEAFDRDARLPLPDWATVSPGAAATPATVLVVEDDPGLRQIVVGWLRQSGYRPVAVESGERALEAARLERPALILLDVELPGVDGYVVCRRLKASGDLASIPIMFTTTRSGVDDRLNGLALGADDFLQKPLDPRELMLRVNRLVRRGLKSAPAETAAILTYEAFLLAAQETCETAEASLALVRLPAGAADHVVEALVKEARRRDLVGRYDRLHAVVLMPGVGGDAARRRLDEILTGVPGVGPVDAGVVAAPAGSTSIEALLADADQALAEARAARSAAPGAAAAAAGTHVVLADDDPDVVRIVDAQMRHAGYRTTVAFDGVAAVDAVKAQKPALLVLDLMMPKQTGFAVLQQIQSLPSPPRVVVLSGRGREEDVTRAFELGADDYLTKPFNPQELMARAARLLR